MKIAHLQSKSCAVWNVLIDDGHKFQCVGHFFKFHYSLEIKWYVFRQSAIFHVNYNWLHRAADTSSRQSEAGKGLTNQSLGVGDWDITSL